MIFRRDPQPPPPTVRDVLLRSEVMVTLDRSFDEGYQGVLWSWDDTGLMLSSSASGPLVHVIEGGGDPRPVDGGKLFVPAAMVKCVQVLRGGR